MRPPPPFDFSKATKLKNLEFFPLTLDVPWITRSLVTAKSLRKIVIQFYSRSNFSPAVEATRPEVQDLDRALVQLWTSRSIRPEITFISFGVGLGRALLPELTNKGVFDHLAYW